MSDSPPATAATGRFQTVNGQVLDPGGKVFTARGINISPSQMDAANQVLALFPGLNFVRLTVTDYQSPDTYAAFVNTMTSHGIVVEFEDHTSSDGAAGGGGRGVVYTGQLLTNELNWYSSIARTFASNPYVWFGTDNEPSVTDPTSGQRNPAMLSSWQQQTYNAIRSTGNNSPIIMQFPGGGYPDGGSVAGYGMDPNVYAPMSNVIAGIHLYGWSSNFLPDQQAVNRALAELVQGGQSMTTLDGHVPVILDEYGISTEGAVNDANGTLVLQAAQHSNLVIGGAAFTWNADGADSLTDGQGHLTPYGQEVAQWIASGSQSGAAISSPPPPPSSDRVILRGSSSEYSIANNNGSLFIQDHVSGRDVTQTTSATKINFTDGTGVFDPTGTGEDVSRIYTAALGRLPDEGGLVFWTSQVDGSHVPLNHIAADFTTSPEFIQHYGALSDANFVNQLYQNVLGRPGEAAGVQSWENTLAAGTSRGTVVEGFAQSPENRAKTLSTAGDKNDAEATRVYAAAFNRAPDAGGEAFWSGQLANGATPIQIAQGFVSSPEFQGIYGKLSVSDFVSQLYQNVLHRAGDPGGQAFWTGVIQSGASQASVVIGFSDSIENRAQTAGATHDSWVFIPT
jgi:hypothetical protein